MAAEGINDCEAALERQKARDKVPVEGLETKFFTSWSSLVVPHASRKHVVYT